MIKKNKPTYIVAVSGGVDSCVLLHMLVNDPISLGIQAHARLVVAHVNHGIRQNSDIDELHVKDLANQYGLEFESVKLNLGQSASENTAREVRYKFLFDLVKKYRAEAVILAHHHDDLIETAVMNIMRGSGRRGLSSLKSSDNKIRPLLKMNKSQIIDYANKHGLHWVEDETNNDTKYTRNMIRHKIAAVANEAWREDFNKHIEEVSKRNYIIDAEISSLLNYKLRGKAVLSRSWFVKLPHDLACEVMLGVLSRLNINDVDRLLVESLTIALKVARPGKKFDVDKRVMANITKRSMRFIDRKSLVTLSV